jgi:hypothetical protein
MLTACGSKHGSFRGYCPWTLTLMLHAQISVMFAAKRVHWWHTCLRSTKPSSDTHVTMDPGDLIWSGHRCRESVWLTDSARPTVQWRVPVIQIVPAICRPTSNTRQWPPESPSIDWERPLSCVLWCYWPESSESQEDAAPQRTKEEG